jgi:hypothetical protein
MREVGWGGEEICAPHLRSGVAGGRGGWEGRGSRPGEASEQEGWRSHNLGDRNAQTDG